LNLDIFNRLNEKQDNKGNFIKNFIQELNDFLNKESNKDLEEYKVTVASEPNINGNFYLTFSNNNKFIKDEFVNVNDLPEGTQNHSILKYKNGKYTLDEEASKINIAEWQQIYEERANLLQQYKIDGVAYEVLAVEHLDCDPSVRLKNTVTGLDFSTKDFYKEEFFKLQEGMILQCKDGNYILPNK